MKQNIISMFRIWLLMMVAVAWPATSVAADDTGDVDAAESAAMAKTKQDAPVWQETDPTGANYLSARRALVGRHCAVNRVINVVSVGSGTSGLENLTNEDITDYASFPSTAGVTIAASPTVSVRDMKNYYAAGTTAGFCIVASSGSSVVNLDVVKTMHIWFYCDGKRVADKTVREGNAGSGVKLSLIGIPGDQEACVNLTAVCDQKFDEVALVQGGGLDVSVASLMRIKYAFVGEAHDITLTTNGIANYAASQGKSGYTVSCDAFMPSPLVGGIPIPMTNGSESKVIDDNLNNTIALVSAVQLASVAFKGRVRVNVENSDDSVGELFHAGDQVGFKYNFVDVANVLEVGTWVDIALYDHKGKKVQTTTISAEALSLSIASGGDQTSYIIAEQDFSGAHISFYTALGVLNLGSGFGVYYGFVRPKPTVDHECVLNPTCSTDICDSQTTFQLKSNPEINATWSLVSQPAENAGQCSVTPDGYVTGMKYPGKYVFRVTSEDGCFEDITINQGTSGSFYEDPVDHALYNIDPANPDYALSDDLHGETSANLLSISDFDNPDAVLNADLTDCASYTGGLQLLGSNGVIVGVRKLDPANPYIYDGSKADALDQIHVGFVVEMEQTALGLNLLDAFQIRCFDENGNRLYSHIVEDAGVLGLGLIGSNDKSNTLRLSITVPRVNGDGEPVKINEIQLWKIGALSLNVSDIKIYYAFWDDPTDKRNNIIRDGATIVTYDNMGAIVNVGTQVNVAAVGGVTNNLSNIIDIDDELETYALMQKTVEAGSCEIIVKLGRTLDFRHQVGVVVNNDIVGLNANVGNVLKVGTYYNGEETGEASSNWGVLGANVIQGSGKTVLLIQPKSNYDEVHITAGEGLGVNRTIKIYGILIRNDIDNDGVPDNRDTESCITTLDNIQVTKVCAGGTLQVQAIGTSETNYFVSLPDQDVEMQPIISAHDGTIDVPVTTKEAGRYMLYFYDGNKDLLSTAEYTVYPLLTTWRKTTNNTDWNRWDNWTHGSPYLCTDVIIPNDARVYPSLDESVVNGDEYGCSGIHFESRAAVQKVFKLNYEKAWVDVEIQPERYYLLSAPLKSMYTGDIFIAAAAGDTLTEWSYFKELTGSSYIQNRFEPRVYQRVWDKAADNMLYTGTYGTAEVQATNWSARFNALKYGFKSGEGFSAYVDPEGREGNFTFRFPKNQTAYNYFNEIDGTASTLEEKDIDRTDNHRFIYETAAAQSGTFTYLSTDDRKLFANVGNITVNAEASTTSTTFLVGNPFMSHIDVQKFKDANSKVTSVKVYNGQTTSSAISVGSDLASTDGLTTIEPMEAFFITVADADAASSFQVLFTEDMFFRPEKADVSASATLSIPAIKITATAGELSTSTLLVKDAEESSETVFDNTALPQLAVFTLDANRALDIRNLADEKVIPIGLYVKDASDVTLSVSATDGVDLGNYSLLDRETGITYDLRSSLPAFSGVESSVNRFALVSGPITGIDLAESDGLSIDIRNGKATITANSTPLRAVTVYSPDGRTIDRADATRQAIVNVNAGVNLIKVELQNDAVQTYKILAR